MDLFYANLTHADLSGTYLTDANLTNANLGRALFEPKSPPGLRGIATAKNLELLTYFDNPDALVQLRKQFEEGRLPGAGAEDYVRAKKARS